MTNSLAERSKILDSICHDYGLKYVISKKYDCYFKDVNQHSIYRIRQVLGVKLFEHYDGLPEITEEKIDKLIGIYEKMLYDDNFVKESDFPYLVESRNFEIVQ